MSETTTETAEDLAAQDALADAVARGDDDADSQLGEGGKKALDAERAARKAAEKSAADLKAQLDKINQANESAVERAQREANEARAAADKATADALRFRVASKHGISEEDADLFLTGTDADTLERQAARLVERTPTTSAAPRPDLTQGGRGKPAGSSPEQDFANFLGAQMSGRG